MAGELEHGQDAAQDTAVAETVETPKRGRRAKPPVDDDARAQDIADLTPSSESPADTTSPDAPVETATDSVPEDPLLQRLTTEFGYENVTDRSEAEQRLLDDYAQTRRELDEQRAWRRENEALVGYGRQALVSQPQQTQAQQPEPKPWEAPVEYPEAARRYLTKNIETGAAEWKPDTPAEVRAQTEKYVAWQQGIIETITERPDQFFKIIADMIDDRAKTVVEPFYEQRTKQQREEEFLSRYEQDHAAKIYRSDPRTGQPVYGQFSERGWMLNERLAFHRKNPNLTVEEALQYAEFDVERATAGKAPAAPVTQPATTAEQQRRAAVARGNRRNGHVGRNRVGSIPQPGELRTQNDNGGFGAEFVEELERLIPSAS